MTENKIKEIMLDLGQKARMASRSVCTLNTKTKNDILLTANPRKRGESMTKCGTETSIKTSVKTATPRPG